MKAAWLAVWVLLWSTAGNVVPNRDDYRLPLEVEERLLADARAVVAEENAKDLQRPAGAPAHANSEVASGVVVGQK